MANERILTSLLNEIEMISDPEIGEKRCSYFSLEVLTLIRHKLPPPAVKALEILDSYLSDTCELSMVKECLEGLWAYLKEFHHGQGFENPAVAAIRAVIFPLYAQKEPKERDLVDHFAFFLELVNRVEAHYQEEESLLRKHFPELPTGEVTVTASEQ